MTRSFFVLALFVALASGPAPATAQDAAAAAPSRRVLVLVPAGDARHARALGSSARERATATLTERGFAAARGPAGCAEPECANELLSSGAADYALALALWGRARCDRVAVTLVDAQGVAHGGEVAVSGTDVSAAIDGAIAAALEHLASGGSSVLSLTGSPAGATITLDQIPWGTLPHEDRVPRGAHQVAVSADGYTTDRRAITIESEPVSLEIALVPVAAPPEPTPAVSPEPTSPSPQPTTGPDVVLLAVGGALAGVGVGLFVPGVYGLAASDGPVTPELTYERTNVPVSATYLSLGAAALVGGVVLLVMGATSGGTSGAPTTTSDLARGVLLRF